MSTLIIPKELSRQVLMIGVYYKNHAPGGMAAVVQYYEKYMEGLKYIPTWRLTNKLGILYYALSGYCRTLFNLLTNKEIKIVHIHTAADNSFWRKSYVMKMSKCLGKKVILHMHASRFKDFYTESTKKEKIVATILQADKLIVLSQSWKEWFISIGIPQEMIIVLNNITAYPTPATKVENDGKIHLLFMGELGQRKGVFDLVRAIASRKEEFKGKILLRIGGNTNEQKLIDTIKKEGLNELVQFEGWVAGNKKAELLNWADIYVLPSFNEGLPIGILEAMSYGCAIISTPVGGIPEVVTEGVNGKLVTPGNDQEIGEAIAYFVNKPSEIKQCGDKCKKVVENYLPESVLTHLKEIYQSLL